QTVKELINYDDIIILNRGTKIPNNNEKFSLNYDFDDKFMIVKNKPSESQPSSRMSQPSSRLYKYANIYDKNNNKYVHLPSSLVINNNAEFYQAVKDLLNINDDMSSIFVNGTMAPNTKSSKTLLDRNIEQYYLIR